jgi:hypothetical protein
METENRWTLAASIAATGAVGGAALVWPFPCVGWLLIGSAPLILLWGCWPKIKQRAATRNKLKEKKRRLEAERLHDEKVKEEGRTTWREPCRAWEEFYFDAGRLVTTMDNFRYEYRPNNWQELMVIKSRVALSLARTLRNPHNLEAERLIRPFEKNRLDASPWDFQSELILLRDWLFRVDLFYRSKKQAFDIER